MGTRVGEKERGELRIANIGPAILSCGFEPHRTHDNRFDIINPYNYL